MTITCWITYVMDPAVPFILMLTISILICIFFLLAAPHGRPESKGTGRALNARMLGTPLNITLNGDTDVMCVMCIIK